MKYLCNENKYLKLIKTSKSDSWAKENNQNQLLFKVNTKSHIFNLYVLYMC